MFGEILLGRGLHAVSPVPQEDVIQIDVEDLFLAQVIVDAVGQDRLPDLAGEALLGGEQDALHHLLGDGAAAFHHVAGLQVAEEGPGDAGEVHPGVLEEAGVFGGHKGQDQVPGQAAVRHFDALFRVELADALAVPGEDLGHHRRPEFLNRGEIRQVAQEMVIDVTPGRGGPQEGGKNRPYSVQLRRRPSAAANGSAPCGRGLV